MSHVDEGELTAYADGAYAPADADAQRIAAHLAECGNCRNRLAQVQAVTARAAEVLAVATPLALQTPPFEQVRSAATPRRRFRAMPVTWAATVILALGIGWYGRGTIMPTQIVTARAPAEISDAAASDAASQPTAIQPERAAAAQIQQSQPPRISAREVAAPTEARVSVEVATQPAAPTAPPSVIEGRAADLSKLAATGAATGNAVQRQYMSAAEAEERGITMHIIPELEVVRVESTGDRVAVEQKLADGTIITVTTKMSPGEEVARRKRTESFADAARVAKPAAAVVRGDARITVTGPLSDDSLRALAAKVR